MKNNILNIIFLLVPLTVFISCKKDNTTPLNIIIIMADDLGYETIGANGGTSYQTPAIDHMATNGMRFEHC